MWINSYSDTRGWTGWENCVTNSDLQVVNVTGSIAQYLKNEKLSTGKSIFAITISRANTTDFPFDSFGACYALCLHSTVRETIDNFTLVGWSIGGGLEVKQISVAT